ncbi:hypothetical protein [Burkholderia sp. LMU1-1-1.1]|uniref:hypothetical protein n=1 Tax=Burkholderia sp. LMU1-1-1.1 TaxID=3135266 RepID=UPI00342DDB9A
MTMPIKFDTLEYARRLVEAGIPADQADAHAQALSDALATASVTPAELMLVRSELLARMDTLKSEVYARMDRLKVEIDARFDQLKVEIDARFDQLKIEIDARFESKLRPLRWLLGIALAGQVVALGLAAVILTRLPG